MWITMAKVYGTGAVIFMAFFLLVMTVSPRLRRDGLFVGFVSAILLAALWPFTIRELDFILSNRKPKYGQEIYREK